MTNFENILSDDAISVFSGADNLGELVTYKNKLGVQTTFAAQVFREPPAPISNSGGPTNRSKFAAALSVFLPRDPLYVNGIPEPPDRSGADSVIVAEVYGGTPIAIAITSILSSDPGGWLVKLK